MKIAKSRKGEWGYFRYERVRRILLCVLMFAIPLLILFSGILYFKTKNNLLTVVAMIGMIPAAMSLVSVVMFMMRTSLPEEEYETIRAHEGTLTMAYELYMTSEKQNALVDAIAICGNEIVGLVTDDKTDARFAAEHLTKMLRAEGYKVTVRMLTDLKKFTDRMDGMNEHADSLRSGISFQPNPAYEGYGREDLLRHYALNISL